MKASCPRPKPIGQTEYSDLILSVKIVASLDEAIDHINRYGSQAIRTQSLPRIPKAALRFMNEVDSAGVYQNASTRFADGFRYGFGAELGISTSNSTPAVPWGSKV